MQTSQKVSLTLVETVLRPWHSAALESIHADAEPRITQLEIRAEIAKELFLDTKHGEDLSGLWKRHFNAQDESRRLLAETGKKMNGVK